MGALNSTTNGCHLLFLTDYIDKTNIGGSGSVPHTES